MRCKLALINFETSANKKDVYKQNFYDYQILGKCHELMVISYERMLDFIKKDFK